jgi:ubiquinone/menaquinone biosynthesis C-methylase UbiE
VAITYEYTKTRYRGKKAATYEAVRKKQARWALENEAVERYMAGARGKVLDVPVGTGRFLPLWARLRLRFTGIDSSDEMLEQARTKMRLHVPEPMNRGHVVIGDATDLQFRESMFESVACIRFLDLIPEDAMMKVLRELCRVAKERIVLTIRLGETYVHKSNTCTHDRKKFYRAVKRLGWQIEHATPIFGQGWEVIKLVRQ